jgi:hypothetical protein
MRKSAIAAAWLLGATVPVLASILFVFGCCVLPFHGVVHKMVPLCHVAIDVIQGGHHEHDGQQPLPAQEKQEPARRMATDVARSFRFAADDTPHRLSRASTTAYRSFITLGALRCDQDVGLHLLAATLLI